MTASSLVDCKVSWSAFMTLMWSKFPNLLLLLTLMLCAGNIPVYSRHRRNAEVREHDRQQPGCILSIQTLLVPHAPTTEVPDQTHCWGYHLMLHCNVQPNNTRGINARYQELMDADTNGDFQLGHLVLQGHIIATGIAAFWPLRHSFELELRGGKFMGRKGQNSNQQRSSNVNGS